MSILLDMDLPETNPNDELEELSEQRLSPFFALDRFQIRKVVTKDKGIDWYVELKANRRHTSFNGLLQLKATASEKKNVDGSFSIQIDTSNIQYLLNSGQIAFYVIYLKNEDTFYYRSVDDFHRELIKKNIQWGKQASHTLRVHEPINSEAVDKIYTTIHDTCQFHRQLKDATAGASASINGKNNIIVNDQLTLSSDYDLRIWVETYGFFLINDAQSEQLIELVNQKASKSIDTTALFCLILGIANYYTGRNYDSLTYLHKAERKKNELSLTLREHLNYFQAVVKHATGMVSKAVYQAQLNALTESSFVGLYIRLEKAKHRYFKDIENPERYQNFLEAIKQITESNQSNNNIRLLAQAESIFVTGSHNVDFYRRTIHQINQLEKQTGPSIGIRSDALQLFSKKWAEWVAMAKQTVNLAIKENNLFAINLAKFHYIEICYELEVISDFIQLKFKVEETIEARDDRKAIEDLIEFLLPVITSYKNVRHLSNLCNALALQYRLLDYSKKSEEAASVLRELEDIINENDLSDERKRLEFTLANGILHRHIKQVNDNQESAKEAYRKEANRLSSQLKQMDLQEKITPGIKFLYPDALIVELYPIGHFQFPPSKLEQFFQLLQITNLQVIEQLKSMFKTVIPVINILYKNIDQEGYREKSGHEIHEENTFKRIFEVRKKLYKSCFYRVYSW